MKQVYNNKLKLKFHRFPESLTFRFADSIYWLAIFLPPYVRGPFRFYYMAGMHSQPKTGLTHQVLGTDLF